MKLKRGKWNDGLCGLRMQTTLFIVKPLEVEQPRVIIELKLPESRKVTRKHNDPGEGGDHRPSVVAIVSLFSYSCLSSTGMVIGGVPGES